MSALFNRKIEFSIDVQQRLTESGQPSRLRDDPFQTIHSFRFDELQINVSLNKSRDRNIRNTGSVTVTNISIDRVHEIMSTKQQYLLRYKIRAGHQPQEEHIQALPVISEGFIMETSWAHEGGNVSMTFFTSEGSKKASPAQGLLQFSSPRGETVWKTIERLESAGTEFLFVTNGGREETKKILSKANIAFPVYFIAGQDIIKPLNEMLLPWQWEAYFDNGKIILKPRRVIGGSLSLLYQREISRTGVVKNKERLNFKNGLLSASAEHTFDYTTNTGIPFVNFRAFFRPHLYPGNFMEITEPRYKTLLGGEYLIENVSIALNNELGPFYSSGRAVHIDFYNLNMRYTYRDFLIKFRRKTK